MADPAAFDFLFQQADVDRDGKVSGSEAIHFFKGANLPQPVLAKIWHAADHGHTGFLSRPEFYNALKLVTVAQSGRELTPEIMRAALVGPASLKIPAPKIQLPGTQLPVQGIQQQQTQVPTSVPATPTSLQQVNMQQPTGTSFSSSQPLQNSVQQTPRPSFSTPSIPQRPSSNFQPVYQAQPRPVQEPTTPGGMQGQIFSSAPIRSSSGTQNFSAPQPVQPAGGVKDAFTSSSGQFQGIAPQPSSVPPTSRSGVTTVNTSLPSTPSAGTKPSGFDSPFGGDAFSASNQARSTAGASFVATTPNSTPPPVTPKQSQPLQGQVSGGVLGAQGIRPSVGGPAWPKMTTTDVQRYSRIFLDVDTDKDGKITGIQARDLFLSWRLPREILKQVWDLSDQDGDSMLSFREFCTALYLMERFREGRPLPPVLPVGFHFDDGSHQSITANRIAEAHAAVAQHHAGFNVPAWQRNPRILQPGAPGMMVMPPAGMVGQEGGRNARNRSRGADMDGANKPVQSENKVLDSKEKLEYYRNKLQEIVLFKRKCDNRLLEITDKAAAEKREEESMAKKYDEKYKQALEVNTHLVSEEAAFREMQTLKTELRNAIAEIERGGNPNALLQTWADRISNDLDELDKALVQRAQLLGFHVNGTTKIELPFGWQPGLQENAVDWDENWDKFDDEGYTTIQSIMDEPSTAKTSPVPGWDDASIFADDYDFASKPDKDETPVYMDSPRAESETSSIKSGVDSPQWSPKDHPAKRGTLPSSPLSVKTDQSYELHEEDHHNETPAYANSSFDEHPSFDSGDHYDDKPWSSAFSHSNDDFWGLGGDSPQPSLAVRTRPERESPDIGSLSIVDREVKNDNEFFGSRDWIDRSGDTVGSSSVPSTPLFKTDSPAHEGSFFS